MIKAKHKHLAISFSFIALLFSSFIIFHFFDHRVLDIETGRQVAQVGGGEGGQNPRLFFSKEGLVNLRNNATLVNAYKNYYKTSTPLDWASPDVFETDKSNKILSLAMNLIVLDPDDPAIPSIAEQIRQGLLYINNGVWPPDRVYFKWDGSNDVGGSSGWYPGGVIYNYAIAYDFVVGTGYLTGTDLEKVRSRLLTLTNLEYNQLMNSSVYQPGIHDRRITNTRFRSIAGIGMAVLAIPDQNGPISDPENILKGQVVNFNSSEILQSVIDDLLIRDNSMTTTDDSGKGTLHNFLTSEGVYTEGHGYISDSFSLLLPFMASYERITGKSFFKAGDLTDGRVIKMFDWILKTTMPNNRYPTFDTGFMDRLWFGWDVLAKYSNYSGEYNWYFENIANRTTSYLISILADLSGVQVKTPTFRTEFFEASGNAVFRDKWGTDATYMMFLAEHDPNRSSHEHADQTSFSIYAKEAYLAIDPGDGRFYPKARDGGYVGGPENWIHSAYGHNLILVDSNDVINSGINFVYKGHPGLNYFFNSTKDPAYLQNSFASDNLDFSEARMTYSDVNVDLVRSVVFPRHQYFVVFDDLKAQDSHEYKWQIHFGSSPESVSTDRLVQDKDIFTWTMKNTKGGESSLDVNFLKGSESYNIKRDGPTNYFSGISYDHTYIQAISNKSNHNYLTLLYPRYSTDPSLKTEELIPIKAWKITGSFSGYDILINQESSQNITTEGVTTDARFALVSFDGNSNLINILAKNGSSINIQSTNKTCLYSMNSVVFHKEVNLNNSGCSLSSNTPTPTPLPDPVTPTPTPDPTNPLLPTNGLCGSTLNACSKGTFSDTEDSNSQYLWMCLGLNGGQDVNCAQDRFLPPPATNLSKDIPKLPRINTTYKPKTYTAPTIDIPDTLIDTTLPNIPSWLDVIVSLLNEIVTNVTRGAKRVGGDVIDLVR